MYYKNAKAAIVVYDVTDKKTFQGAKNWIGELQEHASSEIVIALVGNKADLVDLKQVTTEVTLFISVIVSGVQGHLVFFFDELINFNCTLAWGSKVGCFTRC